MKTFSEKVYLQLQPHSEDFPGSDQQLVLQGLADRGYSPVTMPLAVLRRLYPLCRQADYRVTVTLVYRETDWVVTHIEAGDTRNAHYALAVDYGSTTMVMELVDMNSGSVLARARETNGQVRFGTDILTRITYVLEDPARAAELRRAATDTMERLFDTLSRETGVSARACPVLIVSGNTTMIHFLLELDAWTVFAAPYAPVVRDPGWFWGRELGLDFEGVVYCIPAISNYVGGDIVSGLLNLDIRRSEELRMFFDIGTNGELVIGCRDWLMAGAGAAGPALEGYISKDGMQARPGAVDHVYIKGRELSYTTIADAPPLGICGSGIIDLIAQMRLHGWINAAGTLEPEASGHIQHIDGEYAVVYAAGEDTPDGRARSFSQTDIRQYLETKAAAYTMVDCLLEQAGCSPEEIGECWLSGAFSAHSDLENAITVGIFPDLPRENFRALANASLDGARTLLLDRERMEDIRWFCKSAYCVQFASIPDFLIRMRAALFIPHTDMERFPRVRERLPETRSAQPL